MWRTLPIAPCILLLCAVLGAGAASAEPKYTLKDVTACSKDAMRLCRDKLPDLDRIEECMRANIDNLHPACRARFSQAH